jgi:hypothetical protein
MKRKEQYADEIIEMLERTKCGAWASNINLNTKDRVIEVCQNCVDSWSGRKFKDHCTTSPQALERTRWIPVIERLPELNKPLLVTAYHRVCYAHMISEKGNYGYPVFRLHELKDSGRGWVQETISHEPYSKGRIDAWMYIDIPEPYNGESED